MSKIITSPVKRWPGTITLSDPLTLPQAWDWQDALAEAATMYDVSGDGDERLLIPKPGLTFPRINFALLPAALKLVERWDIQGLPEHPTLESFPGTPRSAQRASAQLIAWLIGEVSELYNEAEAIPNA